MTPTRVTVPAKGIVTLEPFEPPPVGPDQVLLEADVTVISPGTELAWLHQRPGTDKGLNSYGPIMMALITKQLRERGHERFPR